MIGEIIKKSRSYRRFYENVGIPSETIVQWIDNARYIPSAHNLQPLRYCIIHSSVAKEKVHSIVKWAAYLTDWNGPIAGERPSAYICVLADNNIKIDTKILMCCAGIACQTILLQAAAADYGGCIIGAFEMKELTELLNLEKQYAPLLLIAIGKPNENIITEEIKLTQSVKYYRDNLLSHHVPKLELEYILLKEI